MATPFTVTVRVEKHNRGAFVHNSAGDWFYSIHIGRHRVMTGERDTRYRAKRAARSQLKQLQRDIDQALKNLP